MIFHLAPQAWQILVSTPWYCLRIFLVQPAAILKLEFVKKK
jgi:hypothetical protein